MTDTGNLFPLEFHLIGDPLSQGASATSRERWKAQIRGAALRRIAATVDLHWVDSRPLCLTIFYFPDRRMVGDIDNIVKPIVDALKSTAYPDDRVVERIVAQKFDPGVPRIFAAPSRELQAALNGVAKGEPVVYIRLDDDTNWRSL